MLSHNKQTKEILFSCLREGGKIVKRGYSMKTYRIWKKGPVNLVTAIDIKTENKIVSILKNKFPAHQILTEESPPLIRESPYRWIIDPLDGTTNFAHKIPLFCISIALEFRGEIVLGGIYNPLMEELFFAELGKGAFLNGKRIHVSKSNTLSDSLLVTGFPYDRREKADFYLKYFKAMMERSRGIRRLGAAALDLGYVACGRFDAFWELNLKPWDIAAGSLIIKEAGGKITDFNGDLLNIDSPNQLLASNGKIHSSMLSVFKKL